MRTTAQKRPLRATSTVAPIRICDNGHWSDTWFAEHGKIVNIGVYPCAEVQIKVYPYDDQEKRIIIHARNDGKRYALQPERPGTAQSIVMELHLTPSQP